MFTILAILLATLVSSGLGIPLASEPQHDMKQFLSPRIVGGKDAPPGYGNHMAALVWGETMTHLMCGGSIITLQHILTAAHCIDAMTVWGQLVESFRGVIGSNKWTSTNNNIMFTGHVIHSGFSWDTLKYDIGVLYLAEDVVLGDSVAIIPLNFEWVDGGTKSFATGWGRLGVNRPIPDKLQLLYLNTITPQECIDGINEVTAGWWGTPPPYDPKIEICTFHSIGHGMCNGDSGSALVQEETRQQIGIVSWGFPCAIGAPDVFVRISGLKDWITDVLGPLRI